MLGVAADTTGDFQAGVVLLAELCFLLAVGTLTLRPTLPGWPRPQQRYLWSIPEVSTMAPYISSSWFSHIWFEKLT